MTAPPEGAQRSPDGNYWWDEQGQQWQPVDHSQSSSASSAGSPSGSQEQPLDWSQYPALWTVLTSGDVNDYYNKLGIDPQSLVAAQEGSEANA